MIARIAVADLALEARDLAVSNCLRLRRFGRRSVAPAAA
jgi:hypothetical protein